MFTVIDNEGLRLDSYLANELNLSRSKVQKLIKDGKVLVNGREVSSSYSVKLDDEISVNDEMDYTINVEAENIPLDIVYEDDDLIIINKKSGMVVHPAPGHYTGTLVNALLYKYGELAGEKFRPGIVHRLDKDTSGIIVFAKSDIAYLNMIKMFSERRLQKSYYAIVCGTFDKQHGIIECPIGRHPTQRTKMAVITSGRQAVTHWQFDKKLSYNLSALKIKILTGRTHQIRVHLSHIGHPLLGDTTYGYKTNYITNIVPPRVMLHASNLEFCHPITGDKISIESPLSDDFCTVINELSC